MYVTAQLLGLEESISVRLGAFRIRLKQPFWGKVADVGIGFVHAPKLRACHDAGVEPPASQTDVIENGVG